MGKSTKHKKRQHAIACIHRGRPAPCYDRRPAGLGCPLLLRLRLFHAHGGSHQAPAVGKRVIPTVPPSDDRAAVQPLESASASPRRYSTTHNLGVPHPRHGPTPEVLHAASVSSRIPPHGQPTVKATGPL